jgi:hypothetical protein
MHFEEHGLITADMRFSANGTAPATMLLIGVYCLVQEKEHEVMRHVRITAIEEPPWQRKRLWERLENNLTSL